MILTETLFENPRMEDTCHELFSEQRFEAMSKTNRKAYDTTRYWIGKISMALKGTLDGIMLSRECVS